MSDRCENTLNRWPGLRDTWIRAIDVGRLVKKLGQLDRPILSGALAVLRALFAE